MEDQPSLSSIEKGLSREPTEQSQAENTEQLGQGSPRSTSWSLRQLLSHRSSCCEHVKREKTVHWKLTCAASGEVQNPRKRWLWPTPSPTPGPSQSEIPDEEDEQPDTENNVRRRKSEI